MREALLATRTAGCTWPVTQCTPLQVQSKTIYGKTRAEVAEELTKAMADRDSGFAFDAENQTVRL
ncbi:MAG: hypothetical protein JOZ19_07530 [Rubrobacter sp.]|nr:hypothetical protein [Rubrobacter sp.]